MKALQKNELTKIKGGAIRLKVGALIIGGIIFMIGVIDGYMRPLRCN